MADESKTDSDFTLTAAFLEAADAEFEANPSAVLARNVVTQMDIRDAAMDRKVLTEASHHVYSTTTESQMKATSQKSSGRCWLFAVCNVMRQQMAVKYNLPADFELSQSYLFYVDKLERANFFLNAIIDTAAEPLDGRLVQTLLQAPVNDGGQWDMITSLIAKHGVMPKSVFPEAHASTLSRFMNWAITNKLREFAKTLRSMVAEGASKDELKATRDSQMKIIHRIVTTHLGTPPAKFDWSYYDKKGDHHVVRDLTPTSFYADHVPMDLKDYFSIVHDPRNEGNRLMTVQYLGNVVGGDPVRYINQPSAAELLAVTKASIEDGEPVWFGCDVGKRFSRSKGIMHHALLDYKGVYGTAPAMTKEDRLRYGESAMTHAMVFTGFDVDASGAVTKLRVENSWGDAVGDKGYLTMSAEWFNQFNYQVVVHKRFLSAEQLAVLEQDPVVLPIWDPMGALATIPSFEGEGEEEEEVDAATPKM